MIGNKSKLEKWIGVPSKLVADIKWLSVDACTRTGVIQYGIRIPNAGGMEPLKEVELGSKEKVDREKADYWFVNNAVGYKTRLVTANVREDEITGIGINSGIFKYKITKGIK